MTFRPLPLSIVVSAILLLSSACGDTTTDTTDGEASPSQTSAAAEVVDYTQDDDRGAVLRKAADVERLHDAPDDFKQFMAGVVDAMVNSAEPDPDCPFSVNVRTYHPDGFAEGGFISCGGNAEIWAKRDGVWREIWAGQTAPDCKAMKEYSVPTSIAGTTCFDEPNERDVDYSG